MTEAVSWFVMPGGAKLTINIKEIEQLIRMMDEGNVAELEMESDGMRIAIRRQAPTPTPSQAEAAQASGPTAAFAPSRPAPLEAEAPVDASNQVQITAPMVGTFYRAPAPDAEPYVREGSIIEVGQPLCIIEAMKLMNEIESEVAGRIVRILVENGQAVEYGQPLFLVEKLA